MSAMDINSVLTAIEREGFLNCTFIASDHRVVVNALKRTPEVEFLLAHKESCLPVMRTRYRERSAEMADGVRLVYFVVFGLARDREMAPDILTYLRRQQGLSIEIVISPWHPFLHGVQALVEISNGQVQPPDILVIAERRDEFLSQLEDWEAQTRSDEQGA